MTSVDVSSFLAYTMGIVVFFVGVHTNRKLTILRDFNIPEPVTGGLLAAAIVFLIYHYADIEINYDLGTRDLLLVYFFTAIGLNARVSDLITGGKPLLIFLGLTLLYIVIQDVIGMGAAILVGLPVEMGILAGSASLIGGHGTAIAWAPEIAALGIENALEIGVASATLGLVIASLIGGPVAKFLIYRHQLKSLDIEPVAGIAYEEEETETISHLDLMSVFLTLHVTILLGGIANEIVAGWGLKLPVFVTCLIAGIVLSNTIPFVFKKIRWPARTPGLALVSDYSLGLFLAMSLMSMQLWTVASLAGPLLIILLLQTVGALIFILFFLFRLMGKDYEAAVLSAGFAGFSMGAMPTAIANMTAVTKANGPAPMAFIILPIVAAFFVDITNSLIIRFALGM